MEKNQNNVPSPHPLFALSKEIEQQGLVVIDGVTQLPVYGEPLVSPYLVLVLNHSGDSHGELDMQPYEFHPHDLAIIYPNHLLLAKDSSEDYCVTLVVVSNSFYKEMQQRITYGKSQIFQSQVQLHLSDEQFQCFSDALRFLKSASTLNIRSRKEILADVMDMLSLMADESWQESNKVLSTSSTKRHKSSRSYFSRFYESLVNHYHESREVRYYAQQLCLSPKYFGSIIIQETGISAGEWIARFVVMRAKAFLRHRPDLTIQQICHELGFSDAAAFSRYFKTNAGITPKEYRDQVLN